MVTWGQLVPLVQPVRPSRWVLWQRPVMFLVVVAMLLQIVLLPLLLHTEIASPLRINGPLEVLNNREAFAEPWLYAGETLLLKGRFCNRVPVSLTVNTQRRLESSIVPLVYYYPTGGVASISPGCQEFLSGAIKVPTGLAPDRYRLVLTFSVTGLLNLVFTFDVPSVVFTVRKRDLNG